MEQLHIQLSQRAKQFVCMDFDILYSTVDARLHAFDSTPQDIHMLRTGTFLCRVPHRINTDDIVEGQSDISSGKAPMTVGSLPPQYLRTLRRVCGAGSAFGAPPSRNIRVAMQMLHYITLHILYLQCKSKVSGGLVFLLPADTGEDVHRI